MLKLQFKDQRKAAIWLVDSRYAIGKDSSNDIIIDENGVSGFHAELRVEDDDRIFLTDAGSINGTFVNGKQIKARTQLRADDIIKIHDVEMQLVDPKSQLQGMPVDASDGATAMTPALQGLSVADPTSAGGSGGVGGVPTGWGLRGKTGSHAGELLPMPATGRAVVGRSQNCDMVLAGSHVSRQHAELYFQSGKLHVKDLGSSNGTYLNRKKVQEAVVKPGDELRFDTLVFQVEAPEAPVQEEEVGDHTMFRAAAVDVAAPAQKQAAAAQPAPAAAPAKPAAQPAASAPPPVAPESGSGGTVIIAVVVIALVAAAGAYFLL